MGFSKVQGSLENPGQSGRRVVWLLFLLFSCTLSLAAEPFLVCIPGHYDVLKLQESYSEYLPHRRVLVFGRIRDLERMMESHPSATVIAPADFPEFHPGRNPRLWALRRGELRQHYFVVSTGKNFQPSELPQLKAGMIDFLGRENLPVFVRKHFGFEPKSLKRVNRREDLITLLSLEAVETVILSESSLRELKETSKQNYIVLAQSRDRIPILTLSAAGSHIDLDLETAIRSQPESINREMGIDGWGVKP